MTTSLSPVQQALLLAMIAHIGVLIGGHSFLLKPAGDFRSFNKAECRLGGPPDTPKGTCPGPCIPTSSWQYNSHHRPVVYRRGEFVTVEWAKNNHRGGFIRLSMVPIKDRMSHAAHSRMAFRYACFASDPVPCSYNHCGTDEERLMYRTTVQIPTVYPDGLYVLGWAWFGGAVRKSSFFGDYWSCSEVLITGGPRTDTYDPLFRPGENRNRVSREKPQSCYSGVDRLGTCKREPCEKHNASFMKPSFFANGRAPPPIRAYWSRPAKFSSTPNTQYRNNVTSSEAHESASPSSPIMTSAIGHDPADSVNEKHTDPVPMPVIGPTVTPSAYSPPSHHPSSAPHRSDSEFSSSDFSDQKSLHNPSRAPIATAPFNDLAQPSDLPKVSPTNPFNTYQPVVPTGPSQYQAPYNRGYNIGVASENPPFFTDVPLPSALVLSSNGV